MTLSCDRTRCGDTSFSEHFPAVTVAPVHKKLTSIRVFIDNSSVEVFGNNGEVVQTNLVFPKSKLN
jgi:sucrose-6-phosphate hydrolase SacC (GH32 family)